MADTDRLHQILHNLLSNAVAVSPDGGTISLRSRRVGEDIELEISDEGPEVAADDRNRIFGRFERRSGDRHHRGSGLGLSIAKSLVELHGGTIGIAERKQAGVAIVTRLPWRHERTQAA
jgi:signal transduction histidine kinase